MTTSIFIKCLLEIIVSVSNNNSTVTIVTALKVIATALLYYLKLVFPQSVLLFVYISVLVLCK